jgi:ribosomal protein S18 acetylase RimI-like enzyme
MLHLQIMTEDDFTAYKAFCTKNYAQSISENIRIPLDQALVNSEKEIDGSLSQGLSTPNQHLYNIILASENGETAIGYLWLDVDENRKRCFIADIYLHEKFRSQGWGTKTLDLLETRMKAQGITRIGLNVFANNTIAQGLYQKMGYRMSSMIMNKWLTD